jgi:2-methylcitrate dehydratase PrpD
LEAKFSMPYLVARALIDGRVGLDAFTDKAIQERRVLALAEKVQMRLGKDLKSTKTGRPSCVTIHLRDGRTLFRQVDTPRGGEEVPMAYSELLAKFHECASLTMTRASADLVVDAIHNLDATPDLRILTTLLRGDAT